MDLEPLEQWHIDALEPLESQAFNPELNDPMYCESLLNSIAFAGVQDGVVLGIAGMSEVWVNRAIAWAIISKHAGNSFVEIHRIVKFVMTQVEYRRIEAHVMKDFPEGHRWARLLGFKWEGTMKAFSPDGRDVDLYAMIRG